MNHEELIFNSLLAAGKNVLETKGNFSGRGSVSKACEENSFKELENFLKKSGIPVVSKFQQPTLEKRRNWKSFFLICPLLGKKELRQNKTDFAVTIAKVENNRPVSGGVFVPAQNLLYFATSENKAYKMAFSGHISEAEFSSLLSEKNLLTKPIRGFFVNILKDKPTMNSKSEAFFEDFKAHFGGSLKEHFDVSPLRLLGVAEGHYDLYPHLSPVREWEIAAFDALVTAAGNMVTKKDGIVPLRYNSAKLKFPGYIAKTNFELDSVDLT